MILYDIKNPIIFSDNRKIKYQSQSHKVWKTKKDLIDLRASAVNGKAYRQCI